jgi:hypothetical protein
MHRISKAPWFGPAKTTRLGIRPVNRKGMVACFLFISLVIVDILIFKNIVLELIIGMIIALIFVWLVLATGGYPNNDVF